MKYVIFFCMGLSVIYSCKKEEIQSGLTVKDYLTSIPIPDCEAGSNYLEGGNFIFRSVGRTDSKGFLKYPKNANPPQIITRAGYFAFSSILFDYDTYKEVVRGTDIFLFPKDTIFLDVKFSNTSVGGGEARVNMRSQTILKTGNSIWNPGYGSSLPVLTKSSLPFEFYVPKGLENNISFIDSTGKILQALQFTPSLSTIDTFKVIF